jgi:hypothetical protein
MHVQNWQLSDRRARRRRRARAFGVGLFQGLACCAGGFLMLAAICAAIDFLEVIP